MWFKQQQKLAGVTAEEIAARMGRDRTAVSHIYTGKRRMSLDWAKAFAEVLRVPLADVLAHAGEMDTDQPPARPPGFAAGDVAPFAGKPQMPPDFLENMGAGRAGVDPWTVTGTAMQMAGYLPGDTILVDTHQSETCRAGDLVIAQVYDAGTGSAQTLFRRYEPPVLVAASAGADAPPVHVVDGRNVMIRGRVIASWRVPMRRGGL